MSRVRSLALQRVGLFFGRHVFRIRHCWRHARTFDSPSARSDGDQAPIGNPHRGPTFLAAHPFDDSAIPNPLDLLG